ncbi:NINE protein [Paenibacillus sanguinis]|uniref:NINE protein n=1 Tax=Paenibacillus sanguinis TaxID=225906 RepID=UPI00037C3749|nr:TM2 domain-containing protein [Paenibacillus sanguinis]
MTFNKSDLSTTEMMLLNSEMNKREKSLVLAYLMLLAGHLGVHRFYMKRIVSGIIQLCLFVLVLVFYFVFLISFEIESYNSPDTMYYLVWMMGLLVTGLGLTIWVIIDACMLPGMVQSWNQRVEQSLIAEIVSHRTGAENRI